MNVHLAVLRLLDAMLALTVSLLLCLLPATDAHAGPIELTDILDIDPLGYSCVPSRFFDDGEDGSAAVAFSLTGKTRLPRTCLPDPCARALTRQELSQLTGTEPILARFSDEWDDYYSRYADHCRREVTVSRPRGNENFWKPILTAARTSQRLGVPTSSRVIPFIPAGIETPAGSPLLVSVGEPVSGVLGPTISPSPIPVPASGVLLGSVLLAGAWRTHRRRKSSHSF